MARWTLSKAWSTSFESSSGYSSVVQSQPPGCSQHRIVYTQWATYLGRIPRCGCRCGPLGCSSNPVLIVHRSRNSRSTGDATWWSCQRSDWKSRELYDAKYDTVFLSDARLPLILSLRGMITLEHPSHDDNSRRASHCGEDSAKRTFVSWV